MFRHLFTLLVHDSIASDTVHSSQFTRQVGVILIGGARSVRWHDDDCGQVVFIKG